MTKTLSQCRVALISTAGVALLDDEPFDQRYILDATELTQVTAPELAQALIDDQVDLVLLVPV